MLETWKKQSARWLGPLWQGKSPENPADALWQDLQTLEHSPGPASGNPLWQDWLVRAIDGLLTDLFRIPASELGRWLGRFTGDRGLPLSSDRSVCEAVNHLLAALVSDALPQIPEDAVVRVSLSTRLRVMLLPEVLANRLPGVACEQTARLLEAGDRAIAEQRFFHKGARSPRQLGEGLQDLLRRLTWLRLLLIRDTSLAWQQLPAIVAVLEGQSRPAGPTSQSLQGQSLQSGSDWCVLLDTVLDIWQQKGEPPAPAVGSIVCAPDRSEALDMLTHLTYLALTEELAFEPEDQATWELVSRDSPKAWPDSLESWRERVRDQLPASLRETFRVLCGFAAPAYDEPLPDWPETLSRELESAITRQLNWDWVHPLSQAAAPLTQEELALALALDPENLVYCCFDAYLTGGEAVKAVKARSQPVTVSQEEACPDQQEVHNE